MNYANLAQKTNFIATSDKFENLPFFLTNINIPGINLSHPELSSRSGTRLKITGDTLTYNNLNIDMLIDEDFLIYQELMSIIKKNINVETSTFGDFYFDFYIELNNSKGNKVFKLNFYNCRIESIGDIELSTQDEATETILSMSMIYDYYDIDQIRTFNILNSSTVPSTPITQQSFTENFNNLDGWTLWGYPSPILYTDGVDTGFSSNGAGIFGSGGVSTIEIPTKYPFTFTFNAKQELGNLGEMTSYLDFGITEGIGIETTSNGRTGSTIMGVTLFGDMNGKTSKFQSEKYRICGLDLELDNNSNDGLFHEYKFQYLINNNEATYSIYKDNIIQHTLVKNMSNHDYFYLYIQGKTENTPQIVNSVIGNYSKE